MPEAWLSDAFEVELNYAIRTNNMERPKRLFWEYKDH